MGIPATDTRSSAASAEVNETVERLLSARRMGPALPAILFTSPIEATEYVEGVALWPGASPLLADIATQFEHFGLRVADRNLLTLDADGGLSDAHPRATPPTLHRFTFAATGLADPSRLTLVSDAFTAHFARGFEIDHFATLIIGAGLTWREVTLVRAATRFVRQAGPGWSERYVIETLQRHRAYTRALVDYFAARFDPAADPDAEAPARRNVQAHIETARTLDEDRILRSLESFVTACVRTNWYQRIADGTPDGAVKDYAAFKLDSAALSVGGPVVPHREIYVYSADVEGIHARSGEVARGGLRFSDRPEDYRTEVLGLMKTQTVKNSPIVPVGAKGAFVRKNPEVPAPEAYSIFVRGMLDVIDNLVDGRIVEPDNTVRREEPDTYLVVAADKGTASFSDLANSIATERGYWLGDAFASGGSTGYDHKAMAITARGAWVSVRRHLESLGIDAAVDPFTVVGIGDMSGDVFGNGMLLSPAIRLVAAFDHRHIFIDPHPPAERAFAERRRLFGLRGSSWDDYDRDAISAGGGVWPRSAKRIPLSPEAAAALGITATELSAPDLIKAIQTAPVDLFWNGGIGTYVKSSREVHGDAADPVNDAVRVDAADLRCRIVGEGGNLGFTQRARIEYALGGGLINADFIDNAAGVASSDLEVNLKIALDVAVRAGDIDVPERNALLASAQEDVARAVLNNSESQSLAIDLASAQAPRLLARHQRLIGNLEDRNGISRAGEVLPDGKELSLRAQAGVGLSRPEIAVLLAQSKNVVRDELLASSVPEDAAFAGALPAYFPEGLRAVLGDRIRTHRLAREIIATTIADDLINHVGPGLIYQLEERLGVGSADVARAYAVVRGVFDVDAMWRYARDRDDLSAAERRALLSRLQHFIERTASWLLRRRPGPIDIPSEIARYRPAALEAAADPAAAVDRIAAGSGGPVEVLDHTETAQRYGSTPATAAEVYAQTGRGLGLDWLAGRIEEHTPIGWWDGMAISTVRDALADNHHALVGAILDREPEGGDRYTSWRDRRGEQVDRFTRLIAELRRDGTIDIARACTVNAELDLLVRATRASGDLGKMISG
ncbi:NAD-glutamate dehydrogenase domain-containing protein [Millisia brevis]|uniref:NAD-glutamate dehydrogenase domain-containing protein n=1 Tax=Millisia brevis TaxID=264148 RepID=UPI0009FFFA0A|nr:NAD-glutamate dehydrogenase domain-containing protein [Millisia brevis]